MNKIPLSKFVKELKSQNDAAERLGTTQGALSKAIRKKREIYVIIDGEHCSAYEIKPFPSQGAV